MSSRVYWARRGAIAELRFDNPKKFNAMTLQMWLDFVAMVKDSSLVSVLGVADITQMGKVYAEALGDVQEVIDTCDFFLGEGRRLYGQTVPSEMPDKQLFTFRMPVGTAMIITAGNFPAAVPSWYIVPALVTGNTIVWKPAEQTAAIAQAGFALVAGAGVNLRQAKTHGLPR